MSAEKSTNLGTTAAKGFGITTVGQVAKIGLQTFSVVILAKILSPHDYGLVTTVMAVIMVADVFRDFGLSAAAIQAPTLTDGQRHTLFWINSGLGFLLGAGLFAAAGVLAWFYHEPRVVPIAQVLSVTFLLSGMSTQMRADLNRHLRFRALVMSDVLAQSVGFIVGLVMAMHGAGVWALVGQQLTNVCVVLVCVAVMTRWRVRWVSRADRAGTGSLLKYGRGVVASSLLTQLGTSMDSFVIGRRFGTESLGLYSRAWTLLMIPLGQVRQPTTTVALPVLARLQQDFQRSGNFIVKGQVGLGYLLCGGLVWVAATADPFIRVFLDERWLGAKYVLMALALAGATHTLGYVGYWVFLSRALTDPLFRWTLGQFLARVLAVVIGSFWGLGGVAMGYALMMTLNSPAQMWYLSRLTPIPLRQMLYGYLRILVVALASWVGASLVVEWCAGLGAVVQLFVGALAVVAIYTAASVIPSIRRDLAIVRQAVQMAVARTKKKAQAA